MRKRIIKLKESELVEIVRKTVKESVITEQTGEKVFYLRNVKWSMTKFRQSGDGWSRGNYKGEIDAILQSGNYTISKIIPKYWVDADVIHCDTDIIFRPCVKNEKRLEMMAIPYMLYTTPQKNDALAAMSINAKQTLSRGYNLFYRDTYSVDILNIVAEFYTRFKPQAVQRVAKPQTKAVAPLPSVATPTEPVTPPTEKIGVSQFNKLSKGVRNPISQSEYNTIVNSKNSDIKTYKTGNKLDTTKYKLN